MSDWRSPLLDMHTKGKIRILKQYLVDAIIKADDEGWEYKTVAFQTWASVSQSHFRERTWPVRKREAT